MVPGGSSAVQLDQPVGATISGIRKEQENDEIRLIIDILLLCKSIKR
jgi:hypothetical protein